MVEIQYCDIDVVGPRRKTTEKPNTKKLNILISKDHSAISALMVD